MIESTKDALSEIEKRGFPDIFRQLYVSKIPLELVGSCAPPRRYFEIAKDLVLRIPSVEYWLPLWESNLEAIVAFDNASETFVRHYYGTTDIETMGKSYQQFVTAFLLELVDSGIWDELESVAALFEYKHTEELRKFVNSCDDSDFEESNRRFVSSVTD